jgi:hypothetical protein
MMRALTLALAALLLCQAPARAAWEIRESKDPITDFVEITLSFFQDGGMIAFQCHARLATFTLTPKEKRPSSGSVVVDVRFDAAPATTYEMRGSRDGVYAMGGGTTLIVLERALLANRLAFRGREPATVLELTPAPQMLARFKAGCPALTRPRL